MICLYIKSRPFCHYYLNIRIFVRNLKRHRHLSFIIRNREFHQRTVLYHPFLQT
jgi:hypothetical protein